MAIGGPSPSARTPGGATVLVVEDDPDIARAVAQCLRTVGYRPVCVLDGEAALAEMAQGRISLVLLDWRLPGDLVGTALVRRIKAAAAYRLPVVVISADPAALTEASQAGVEDYLPKPFQLDDLIAVVDEHCQ